METFFQQTSVLLPIFFVMALGYWAGHDKQFDGQGIKAFTDLVLSYALPLALFVSIVKTKRDTFLSDASFFLPTLVAMTGFFLVLLIIFVYVWHKPKGEAALQSALISTPGFAFFGFPIFDAMFGKPSEISIALFGIVSASTITPILIACLEFDSVRASGNQSQKTSRIILMALRSTFAKPLIWVPLLGAFIVIMDIHVPNQIDAMFLLIGSTTGGVALFLTGIIIATHRLKIDTEAALNVLGKLVLQPVIMGIAVVAFAIGEPLAQEGILLAALASSALVSLIATKYQVYENQCAATVLLTTLLLFATFPIAVLWSSGI